MSHNTALFLVEKKNLLGPDEFEEAFVLNFYSSLNEGAVIEGSFTARKSNWPTIHSWSRSDHPSKIRVLTRDSFFYEAVGELSEYRVEKNQGTINRSLVSGFATIFLSQIACIDLQVNPTRRKQKS